MRTRSDPAAACLCDAEAEDRGHGSQDNAEAAKAQTDLAARVDRLESTDGIRQIAAKSSLALDMGDADAWVALFPEDVRWVAVQGDTGVGHTGRVAAQFDPTPRLA